MSTHSRIFLFLYLYQNCSFTQAFTAQRIFVDLARPFCAHSFAEGRITSFE